MKSFIKYVLWILTNILIGILSTFMYLRYNNFFFDLINFWLLIYPLISTLISILLIYNIVKLKKKHTLIVSLFIMLLSTSSLYFLNTYSVRNDIGLISAERSVNNKEVRDGNFYITIYETFLNDVTEIEVGEEFYNATEIGEDKSYVLSYRYARFGEKILTEQISH